MRPINQVSVLFAHWKRWNMAEMAVQMGEGMTGERLRKHLDKDDDDPCVAALIARVVGWPTWDYSDICSGRLHARLLSYKDGHGYSYQRLVRLTWVDAGFKMEPRIHELENFFHKRVMDGWLTARLCEVFSIEKAIPSVAFTETEALIFPEELRGKKGLFWRTPQLKLSLEA